MCGHECVDDGEHMEPNTLDQGFHFDILEESVNSQKSCIIVMHDIRTLE